jgi:SAM-dependent methyltransferase
MKIRDNKYDSEFYNMVDRTAYKSATIILPLVLNAITEINSAIDFGCGNGIWLSVLKQLGVKQIKGCDGVWIKKERLKINATEFCEVNFERKISAGQRHDLAISLEVAEHIPESMARQFIASLTEASDFVLFSAAVPYQGGTNHINEQWPDYWSNLFALQGYVAIDFLRPQIWNNPEIAWWYKQNMLLYVNEKQKNTVRAHAMFFCDDSPPHSYIHPELYLKILRKKDFVKRFVNFIKRSCKLCL